MTKKSSGYTLIEVLLAIVVFTIAILTTLEIFNLSIKVTQTARENTIAANLAEKQIESYRGQPFSQINSNSTVTQPVSELPDGTMKTTTSPYQGSNRITQVEVEVYWRNRPESRAIKITTLISLGGINDSVSSSP